MFLNERKKFFFVDYQCFCHVFVRKVVGVFIV